VKSPIDWRRTHAQSNYTNTKLKPWFRRLLRHPTRKQSDGPILHPRTHTGEFVQQSIGRSSPREQYIKQDMWVSSFLTAHQHKIGHSVPWMVKNIYLCDKRKDKNLVRSGLLTFRSRLQGRIFGFITIARSLRSRDIHDHSLQLSEIWCTVDNSRTAALSLMKFSTHTYLDNLQKASEFQSHRSKVQVTRSAGTWRYSGFCIDWSIWRGGIWTKVRRGTLT